MNYKYLWYIYILTKVEYICSIFMIKVSFIGPMMIYKFGKKKDILGCMTFWPTLNLNSCKQHFIFLQISQV